MQSLIVRWQQSLSEERNRYQLSQSQWNEIWLSIGLVIAANGWMVLVANQLSISKFQLKSILTDKGPLTVAKVISKPTPERSEMAVMFESYGSYYQVSPELLLRIAYCESTLNPQATSGPYAGLFQYDVSTWIATRKRMGLETDPALRFDAEQAIKTTAYKISKEGVRAWPVCGKVYFSRI